MSFSECPAAGLSNVEVADVIRSYIWETAGVTGPYQLLGDVHTLHFAIICDVNVCTVRPDGEICCIF